MFDKLTEKFWKISKIPNNLGLSPANISQIFEIAKNTILNSK